LSIHLRNEENKLVYKKRPATMTGLFLCLLQYEGRRSALPLGLSKNPQVQVFGFATYPCSW